MINKTLNFLLLYLLLINPIHELRAQNNVEALKIDKPKAVFYDLDFLVPFGFSREIQEYDEKGKYKYRYNERTEKKELVRYLEDTSKKEAQDLIELAIEMFKRKYGYSEIKALSARPGYQSGRYSNFPNRALKRSIKKNDADIYIKLKFDLQDKAFPPAQRSFQYEEEGWSENNSPRKLYMNASCSYTLFNSKQEIIIQKEIGLKEELWEFFSENYYVETYDKGVKVEKLYLRKDEIIHIYKLALSKLENLE